MIFSKPVSIVNAYVPRSKIGYRFSRWCHQFWGHRDARNDCFKGERYAETIWVPESHLLRHLFRFKCLFIWPLEAGFWPTLSLLQACAMSSIPARMDFCCKCIIDYRWLITWLTVSYYYRTDSFLNRYMAYFVSAGAIVRWVNTLPMRFLLWHNVCPVWRLSSSLPW